MQPTRFDVHTHYILPDAPPPGGKSENFVRSPLAQWSIEMALDFMNRHEIATQMLSVPMVLSPALARQANEYGAEAVKQHPDRFGLLAALPMTDVEAALAEITYAFDTLAADGVAMMTNYDGCYLGHEKFSAVFEELNRRRATIFIHPVNPAGYECVSCGRPGPIVEYPFDTCRTAADMVQAGVLARYANLRIILSHAGGPLPLMAERIATLGTWPFVPHRADMTIENVLADLASLYFDTALSGRTAAIVPVLELTSADHLVFGTDYPPAGEAKAQSNILGFNALTCLSPDQKAAVYTNGRRLFPRFGEALPSASVSAGA